MRTEDRCVSIQIMPPAMDLRHGRPHEAAETEPDSAWWLRLADFLDVKGGLKGECTFRRRAVQQAT
jgi:hypothetical protein